MVAIPAAQKQHFATLNSNPIGYIQPKDKALIQTYPQAPIAQASQQYSVTINGQPVFVEQYNDISYAHFAFMGELDLVINIAHPKGTYKLSPQRSAPITQQPQKNQISFSLNSPQKLVLHNRDALAEQLFIFAEALEPDLPQSNQVSNILNYNVDNTGQTDATVAVQQAIEEVADRQGVLYFPPGIYQIQQLNLKSDLTLYLAGGAILQATRQTFPSYGQGLINLSNISNIKILGAGTIFGNGSYWRPKGGWYSLLNISNSDNVMVKDIMIRDPAVANIWIEYSKNVMIENSKILASPQPKFINTDGVGIWSSRDITIDNILYRGTDDATSQGGDKLGRIQNNENINIKNSIFSIVDAGGAFKIGSTIEQDLISQVTYENIDIIQTEEVAGLWPVSGGRIQDIYFKNIHVEAINQRPSEWGGSRLFEWRVMEADWEKNSSANRLGSVQDVYFSNLAVQNLGRNTSLFQGYSASQNIDNVQFDKFSKQGQIVNNLSQAGFQLLPSDRDGKFYVNNIIFSAHDSSLVNIQALPLSSQTNKGNIFQVTRSGDLRQPLTIAYQIRGTAKAGIDYRSIPPQVTIPAGKTSAEIAIIPIQYTSPQPVSSPAFKSIRIRLENRPHSLQYLLDAKFQAVLHLKTS